MRTGSDNGPLIRDLKKNIILMRKAACVSVSLTINEMDNSGKE